MNKNIRVIAATALLSLCSLSQAAIHNQSAYIEGNVGSLYSNGKFLGDHYTNFDNLGFNANLGYQLTPNLATEVGYTNYGNALNNVDAAVKVILPFTIIGNDFSVFAKAGPSFVFKGHSKAYTPLVGLGASYSLSHDLDTTFQVQSVTQGNFNLGLASVGFTYHFE